jgi:hypothetical protein
MGRLLRIQETRRQDVILVLADMVRQSPVLNDSHPQATGAKRIRVTALR